MAILEIACPMCKGSIWIDQSTGKVVDHKSADQKKVDFGEFMKSQEERGSKWDQKMEAAKDDEQKRRAEMEERFRKARENPDEIEGEYESPFKWD